MLSKGNLLFKYRALNDITRPHIEDILSRNKVYFSSRSSFNDPFDSKVRPCFEGTTEEWGGWYAKVLEKHNPEMPKQQLDHQVQLMIDSCRFENIPDWVGRSFPEKAGIFCMSRCYDHLLMWAHYAEGHTGMCIAFSEDNAFFGRAQPITYAQEYPKLSYLHSSQEDLTTAMLLTKAAVWEYEREWRVIEHKKGPGVCTFPPESLVAVILGCEMKEHNRQVVQKWCAARKPSPRVFQACMGERRFALNFKELVSTH